MSTLSISMLLLSLGSAYCLAGCLMEHFTLFEAWRHISSNQDLKTTQTLTGMRAFYIYVVPKTVVTLALPFLVREQPLLWYSITAMAVSWGSSFLVQVPLQLKVRKTGDCEALKRLLRTTWARTVAMVAHCVVVSGIVLWS